MTKNTYEKVGGGSYGVYRKKKEESNWGGYVVMGIIAFFLIAAIF